MEYGSWLHRVRLGSEAIFLILSLWTSFVAADTVPEEAAALAGVASNWVNPPQKWAGGDPCDSQWVGVNCANSHITKIVLSNLDIDGTLSEEIGNLPELVDVELSYNQGLHGPIPKAIGNLVKLRTLILVGCSFSGSIPAELGMLSSLVSLSLNSNQLSGTIPGALGHLSLLVVLDISDNQISGSIPVSDGTNLGLDRLTSCQHFHFGKNNLSGVIPSSLFHSDMKLIHVLFDSNRLIGSIPETLWMVKSLQAVRLDRNELIGDVPSNLNDLTNVEQLYLSNNKLTGSLPNLTGMVNLTYLDMSNNTFDESEVPSWFTTLPLLTTIILEHLSISGQIPRSLFDSPQLQTARLRNNRFNGILDLGTQSSSRLSLVDLQYNSIQQVEGNYSKTTLLLVGNPICSEGESGEEFCKITKQSNDMVYSTLTPNCGDTPCSPDMEMSPLCKCSYPYKGIIIFRIPKFSDITNPTHYLSLKSYLQDQFAGNQVPLDTVFVQNSHMNENNYLEIDLQFFPYKKLYFDEDEVFAISSFLNNQEFNAPPEFGPYYFKGKQYIGFQGTQRRSNSKKIPVVIIGAAVGGVVLLAVIISVVIFTLERKKKLRKAEPSCRSSGYWNASRSNHSSIPQLKCPRLFSFEEILRCTKSFSEENEIGSGAYGRVYRGMLDDGQLVAVKRAQESAQCDLAFKAEIETLSQVNHRNLVSLVGFCFDKNEHILVYEFIPNGTLRESLSGKSGIRLDWKRRLRVALGAAKGLAYLHEQADPPIVHRDIKSNNILLDHHLRAKVSDFGLSRLLFDDEKGYVTTQVKGTMGYLDPNYYLTQQLTEKSDVYSFGILLLEIVTARKPIERGQYIVKQVKDAIEDKKKGMYGLDKLVDPMINLGNPLPGLERFIDLAMKCVDESSVDRPSMGSVVKEIECIMQLAGTTPNLESSSTPPSYGRSHAHSGESSLENSGEGICPIIEPK